MKALSLAGRCAALLAPFLLASTAARAEPERTDEALTESIRFGYRIDAPPFSSVIDGKLAGYSFELCILVAQQIAEDLDRDYVDATLVEVSAQNRFEFLRNRRIDVLCGAATITADRREFMGFSIPIFEDGVGFAISTEAPGPLKAIVENDFTVGMLIETPGISDKRFGVLDNTTTESFLKSSGLTGSTDAELRIFQSHRDGLDAVEAGEIDVYFGSLGILKGLVRRESWPVIVSSQSLTYEPIALGLPRETPDLALLVDRALSRIYRNGDVLTIYERHFGKVTEPTREFFRRSALR